MKIRRWNTILIASVGIFILGPALYVFAAEKTSERRFQAALAELKAMGYPTNAAELKAMAPPDNENAAPIYHKLIREYDARGYRAKMSNLDPVSNELTAADVTYLKSMSGFTNKLSQIQRRPKLWFDRAYERYYELVIPDYEPRISFAKLLNRQIRLDVREKRFEAALDRLATLEMMAVHALEDPALMGWFIGKRIAGMRRSAILASALESNDRSFRSTLRRQLLAQKPDMPYHYESWIVGLSQPMPDSAAETLHGDIPLWVFRLGPVFGRWKAISIEDALTDARLAQDGVTHIEAAFNKKARQERNNSADPLTRLVSSATLNFSISGSGTVEFQREENDLLLAALNVLLEDAGGPKANLPPHLAFQRTTATDWSLKGPYLLLEINGKEFRSQRLDLMPR